MNDRTDLARGWFAKADSDLTTARRLAEHDGPYDTACFHAQQAAEKYLKGFLVFHGRAFPFTHDLEELTDLCRQAEQALPLTSSDVVDLTDFAVSLRYDVEFWPEQNVALDAVRLAVNVRNAIHGLIPRALGPESGTPGD